MPSITESLDRYGAAWNASERSECAKLLRECWATDGQFLNSQNDSPLVGVDQLASYIVATNSIFAGHRTEAAGEVIVHHEYALAPWRFLGPNDALALEGVTFVEFDDLWRIRRAIQFYPLALSK